MKKILLVEDDEQIIEILKYILEKKYIIQTATTKIEAMNLMNKGQDLTILDITLPDGNSLEFSKIINSPIIFLTAKDDEETIIKGLSQSEEYIIKPFKSKELLLRIEKVLNRTKSLNIHYKDLLIDTESQKIYLNDKSINVTNLDYQIITILFTNINKIVTKDQLANLIYNNTSNFVEDNTINVYIKRVRDKLKKDYIKTIKKVGYIVEKN